MKGHFLSTKLPEPERDGVRVASNILQVGEVSFLQSTLQVTSQLFARSILPENRKQSGDMFFFFLFFDKSDG